jgi:hypothetical protein
MSRTLVGVDGTTETDFKAAGTGILATANDAHADAATGISDAAAAQADADAAQAAASASKPISISVGTDATTDSAATVVDGAMVERIVLRIGTQYSAGGTATLSLYNASGSQALVSATAIDGQEAGGEYEFPLDKLNASGYDGVFRVEIGGTPAAGAMTAILYESPAPLA